MEKDNIQDASMNEMIGEIEASMKKINVGDIIKGNVISVSEQEVLVNIGYVTDGIVPKQEACEDEDVNITELFKPEDEIYVYVEQINNGEGSVLLSKLKADSYKVWEQLEDSFNNGTVLEITIKEVVKGGLISSIKGIRAFIPASQVSCSYVEDLNKYVGEILKVKVIEFDRNEKKVVLSGKEVEKVELAIKKEKTLSTLKKGEMVTGVVTRLAKFGAFVDLGGVDGLIHISQMSWKRINDPSEVVSVGDKVDVYVLDIDVEKDRIALALKQVGENPWETISQKYKVNDIVEGTVVNLIDIGAFVQIEDGIEGLVHISEISDDRIAKPSDVLKIGDKVTVKIIQINEKDKRLSLSIKATADRSDENFNNYKNKSTNTNDAVTIGDLLKDKFKDFKFE